MKKTTYLPLLVAVIICSTGIVASADDQNVLAPQYTTPASSTASVVPGWLQRTSFAAEAASDTKPKYFMETIQPLFGTEGSDLVYFSQSRISQKEDHPTYNTGVGVRKIFDNTYLLGVNTFYDYQQLHSHSRGGVGFEAMNNKGIEARLNTYIRISSERTVAEDSSNNIYVEKVANGFDWEVGAPVPGLPMVKLYGGGEWYDFEHFKNKYGWKTRAEVKPSKATRINFEVFDDTKRDTVGCRLEGALTLAFTSFAPKDIIKDIFGAKKASVDVDLHEKTLDRVVRNFDITVIKSKKHKISGLTIEGGRK